MADIDMIVIFLTQNIVDINILYCSAHSPTHIFHYRQQSSPMLFCNFRFGLVEM